MLLGKERADTKFEVVKGNGGSTLLPPVPRTRCRVCGLNLLVFVSLSKDFFSESPVFLPSQRPAFSTWPFDLKAEERDDVPSVSKYTGFVYLSIK